MNWIRVKLTQNRIAKIDKCDSHLVACIKWYPITGKDGQTYAYANSQYSPTLKKRISPPIRMHRLIMNAKSGQIVDHINGNGLDNRRSNLRFVNNSQNSQNQRTHKDKMHSKYKGVTYITSKQYRRKRWKVVIGINSKSIYLGAFMTEKEAAIAYRQAAKIFHGEYAHRSVKKRLSFD